MVPSEEMSSLALYLEKQREARRLSEELEQLKSSQAVEAAIRIKHEIEALMADYELTPEQLLEALCMLFDLAKPVGFVGSGLTEDGEGDASQRGQKASDEGGREAPAGRRSGDQARAGRNQGRKKPAPRAGRTPKKPAPNQSLVPAKRVTILTQEEREAAGKASSSAPSAPSQKKTRRKKKADPAITAPARAKRPMKIFTNPHSGEVVRTRGANHRVLNQWRAKYGQDAVDTWWEFEADSGKSDARV